jgi:hypothetical protein
MKHSIWKYINIINLLYFISIYIIIIYFVLYSIECEESVDYSSQYRTLQYDGFCVFDEPRFAEIAMDPPEFFKKNVLCLLPTNYHFIDYIYNIHNVALSTFHRDVTSSKTLYNTKYPVYTLILYKYDGCLLSLCPRSNMSYLFASSNIYNIHGKSGTCFLFDSDLLHAGCINECKKREVIQYKIIHDDDAHLLAHLSGIKMEKDEICNNSFYNRCLRKFSYFFQMPINTIFYPLMIKKEEGGIIGKIQEYIPLQFYNNTSE